MTGGLSVEDAIGGHVNRLWPDRSRRTLAWESGKIVEAIPEFRVIEVAPRVEGKAWIYLSCGAWRVPLEGMHRLEFLLLSPIQSESLVESLAMVSAMHEDPRYHMHLGKIVSIGRPWLPRSNSDHFMITPPHILDEDGRTLHVAEIGIDFCWLLPITRSEADFARNFGSHVLEERIADAKPNMLSIERFSIV